MATARQMLNEIAKLSRKYSDKELFEILEFSFNEKTNKVPLGVISEKFSIQPYDIKKVKTEYTFDEMLFTIRNAPKNQVLNAAIEKVLNKLK